jgi:hypothetical protein
VLPETHVEFLTSLRQASIAICVRLPSALDAALNR